MTKKNNGSISNKGLLIVVIVLSLVIAGLVSFIIFGLKGDKKKKNEDTTVSSSTDATIEASSEEVNTEAITESPTAPAVASAVKIECDNSWDNSGKVSAGLKISFKNDSGSEINDWKIEIKVPDGFNLDGSWNGNFSVANNVCSITAVDYNAVIPEGGELRDIGCNITVSSQADLDSILKSGVLYINGTLYQASNGAEQTADTTTEEIKPTESNPKPTVEDGTPVEVHGKLSVDGTDIVDKNGNKFQLKGLSSHGLAWFPEYINEEAFKTFRDDWDANVIRLAMYTYENGGYCADGNKDNLKKIVNSGVDYATDLGMYVIIDWHILHDLTPVKYQEESKKFFAEMSAKYKDYDNVIYEICNEPNGNTSWSEVKGYAEVIIPIIRENDPDAIIIVGTPTWSQDVDIAANDPIKGYDNIMYAIHFYAATHTDGIRNKVKTAHDKGLPIFVSEFSICDASGNGAIDYNQADKWFDMIDDYNLSYCAWNISNKDETSSIIKAGCNKKNGFDDGDYSETGIWIKKVMSGN